MPRALRRAHTGRHGPTPSLGYAPARRGGRWVDPIAHGLPLFGGVPICGDPSLASPPHRDGTPWQSRVGSAADVDGVGIARTRQRHEDTYPALVDGGRGRLVVLGTETGGRWLPEALQILRDRDLAKAKCRSSPDLLRSSAELAWWYTRCLRMLSVATQYALAVALLNPLSQHFTELDADTPDLSDVLSIGRESPSFRRLPPR